MHEKNEQKDKVCLGCMTCACIDCGWLFECGDHVCAKEQRHLDGATWSTCLLLGNEARRSAVLLKRVW